MPVPVGASLSDDESSLQSAAEEKKFPRRSQSEPSLAVVNRFKGRRAAKLRKKWLREYYTSLGPQELQKAVKKKRSAQSRKEASSSSSYKYGRLAMIALALFSIPIDGWKLYQGVERTERALDGPTSIEVFDYYSSTIATHVIGLTAAIDNNLILTIGCRMLSTILYQTSFGTKGNASVPTDPKELQKYIRQNVPAHRLPKGYRFTDDLDTGTAAKAGIKKGRKRGSQGKKSKKMPTNKRNKMPTKSPASKKHSARKSSPRDKKKQKASKSASNKKAHKKSIKNPHNERYRHGNTARHTDTVSIQPERIHHTSDLIMTFLHHAIVFASDAYLKLYAAITLLIYIWKGYLLPYQRHIYWLEVCLCCVLLLLHMSCLFLSRIQLKALSAGLILPSISAALYFMIWQQYVLRIEVITNAILILLQGLHIITSFL